MIPQVFADRLIAPNKQVSFNQNDFGQCTAIVHLWCATHHLPFMEGNAVNLWKAADPKYFEVYDYHPGFQSQAGDMIIWAECDPIGVGANGHADMYVKDLGNGHWQGLDQNWPVGSPPRYVTHTWQGVIKIIRIKKEYLIKLMDFDDSKWMYILGINENYDKGQVTQAEIQGNVGRKPSDAMGQMAASPQWLTRNYWATEGPKIVDQLNQKIQQLEAQPSQQAVTQIKQESQAILDTANNLGSQQ